MMNKKTCFLLFTFVTVVVSSKSSEPDTEITRVKSLPDSERGRGGRAVDEQKPKTVYLVNILTLPRNGNPAAGTEGNNQDTNGLNEQTLPDPRRRNPALFFLQKVNDDGRLPDGIYYRPAADETETPKPFYEKDITDVQAVALGQGAGK